MHSSILEPINAYIRSRQRQFTELLRQIITIPSPTGQEGEKAAWVLAYLHSLGQGQAYVDEAGNVLCPCQIEGRTAFPLYSAHMDTVFKGPVDLTPRIDGNMLFLIAMIRDLDLSLPQGALFAFNVGEEGMGNLKGMRRIMADWKGRITEVVAVDCTFDDVVAIPVGSRRYRVSIEAQGGHSWMHFGHTSAIAAAASIISNLYALPVPSAPKTTYNVGPLCGGTTINSIAANAEFTVDLRSESRDELLRLDEAFLRLVSDARRDSLTLTTTLLGERPCSSGADISAQCRRIAAIRKTHCLNTSFIAGSTDANIPLSLGVPALSFGVCRSHDEHTTHEWLELDTIETGLQILAEYMLTDSTSFI